MGKATSNILIGGTSHVGKSTLSALLGEALDCEVFATDAMARHPGRPWPRVAPHVAEFYDAMSSDSIRTFLLHHHQNMWPRIKELVQTRSSAKAFSVIEGSALRPEFLAELSDTENICLVLYAPDELIQRRIYANSDYARMSSDQKSLVDVFIERSVTDNEANVRVACEHGVELINVADQDALREMKDRLIRGVGSN